MRLAANTELLHNRLTVQVGRLEEGGRPGSFRLIGEFDLSNVPFVTTRLQDELRRGHQLELDTSEVTFIDAQGLRMLIELGAQAAQQGARVTVVNCSRQVNRLLDVAVPEGIAGVEILQPDK